MQARARGIDVVITHTRDGAVGIAVACDVALALASAELTASAGKVLACGLDVHEGLYAWHASPRSYVPQLREPAWVVPSERAGHGVEYAA
jgi:hypothetical protein